MILFAPDAERIATSNVWAFLHWLRIVRGRDLAGWRALTAFAVAEPDAFAAAFEDFAGRSPPLPLGEGWGEREQQAEWVLHADLRPDDRMAVTMADAEGATVLVAAAEMLAVSPPERWAQLRALRTIIAVGGPLSPEVRACIYASRKPDVLLLARAGHRLWGSPLDPVPARPGAPRSLFRPR